jgi:phospholipase/lecithinase/hemolysin
MKLLSLLFILLLSNVTQASVIHKMVVFGDSLSDNGNLYEIMKHRVPVSPPYHKGRFSNGPVWVEILAQQYFGAKNQSKMFYDYACGGAVVDLSEEDDFSTFTLQGQISTYLLANDDKADKDTLFVIWVGSNNYLALDESSMDTAPIIAKINQQIQKLLDKGAKHFLIVSVPDLGKVPYAPMYNAIELLTELSLKHNRELLASFNSFRDKNPTVKWSYFEVNIIHENIKAGKIPITNVTDSCTDSLEPNMDTKAPTFLKRIANHTTRPTKNCDDYLFFDEVHPTALAHKVMANYIKELMLKNGESIG